MRLWPRQLEQLAAAANERGEWVIIDQFGRLPIADRVRDKLEADFGELFEFTLWDNSMPQRPYVLKGRLHEHIVEAIEDADDDAWCEWEDDDFDVEEEDCTPVDGEFGSYLYDGYMNGD